jgi:hypothetical protein
MHLTGTRQANNSRLFLRSTGYLDLVRRLVLKHKLKFRELSLGSNGWEAPNSGAFVRKSPCHFSSESIYFLFGDTVAYFTRLTLLQTTHVFVQGGVGVGELRGRQKTADLKQAPHRLWNFAGNCPYSLFLGYAKQRVYTGMLCILNFVFFVASMSSTHTVLNHAYGAARLHGRSITKSVQDLRLVGELELFHILLA